MMTSRGSFTGRSPRLGGLVEREPPLGLSAAGVGLVGGDRLVGGVGGGLLGGPHLRFLLRLDAGGLEARVGLLARGLDPFGRIDLLGGLTVFGGRLGRSLAIRRRLLARWDRRRPRERRPSARLRPSWVRPAFFGAAAGPSAFVAAGLSAFLGLLGRRVGGTAAAVSRVNTM
jgi:hypothetical protein